MSDKQSLKEILSALLDHEAGKIDTLELRRLARAMENEPELAKSYERLTVMRAVMRGEMVTVSSDFLDRVQRGIDAEPVPVHTQGAIESFRKSLWLKAAGQFAAAASVAVIAVWYVQTNHIAETTVPAAHIAEMEVVETEPLFENNKPENKKLGANTGNRLLNSRVLTVGTSNPFVDRLQSNDRSTGPSTDCMIVEQELPAGSGLRVMHLPEDYVLCRMDEDRQRCHAISESLACYSH